MTNARPKGHGPSAHHSILTGFFSAVPEGSVCPVETCATRPEGGRRNRERNGHGSANDGTTGAVLPTPNDAAGMSKDRGCAPSMRLSPIFACVLPERFPRTSFCTRKKGRRFKKAVSLRLFSQPDRLNRRLYRELYDGQIHLERKNGLGFLSCATRLQGLLLRPVRSAVLRNSCWFSQSYSFNVVTTDTPSGMAVMDAFGLPRRSQASFSASCRLCAGVMCSARMVSSGSSET